MRGRKEQTNSDPLLAASHYEESFNVVIPQIDVPFSAKARLHIIVTIEIVQSSFSYVDTAGEKKHQSLT